MHPPSPLSHKKDSTYRRTATERDCVCLFSGPIWQQQQHHHHHQREWRWLRVESSRVESKFSSSRVFLRRWLCGCSVTLTVVVRCCCCCCNTLASWRRSTVRTRCLFSNSFSSTPFHLLQSVSQVFVGSVLSRSQLSEWEAEVEESLPSSSLRRLWMFLISQLTRRHSSSIKLPCTVVQSLSRHRYTVHGAPRPAPASFC